MMKVVHEYTGDIVNVGDEIVDFRGDVVTFLGVSKKPEGASTGRVHVAGDGWDMHYYPSVFALKILPE
jgi:hypothetical protein